MIGFLQPLLALAALAAAVPIVLHLIRRREQRRVIFPAIRYLRRAEERYARRLRLRHLLLLAARVLIVILLAIAAAGPLIGRGDAADHEPTAVAILLDESLSAGRLTGDRRLIDLYAERAKHTLRLSGPDDRLALFSGAWPEDRPPVEGIEPVRRALDTARPTAGVADPATALQAAVAWLRSTGVVHLEVHLFTDLQATSLPAAPPAESADLGRGISIAAYIGGGAAASNAAPGYPEPATHPLEAGRTTRISVPIDSWGAVPPESVTVVRLVVEDNVVAVDEASFGSTALLTLPPQDSGWVQGYVEIDTHGLAADDRRYFTWFSRPPPAVALTGNPGEFVVRALAALERGGRLRPSNPVSADVVLAGDGEGIERALAAGRSVIIIPPADPLDLPRLNSRLRRAGVPWRYEIGDGAGGGASRVAPGAPAGLAGVVVRTSYEIQTMRLAADDSVLVRLDDGRPWLVRGTLDEGAAYLLLGSPLIPEASELPVRAAMVPFMDLLLGDWARRSPTDPTRYAGITRISLPPRAREIRMPDGGIQGAEGGAWFFAEEPGNYAIRDDARTLRAFSINAPRRESDLRPGRRERLERVLPEADWFWLYGRADEEWSNAIFRERRGRHLWRPVVILFFALAIVEASLAAAGRRRAGRPVAEEGALKQSQS